MGRVCRCQASAASAQAGTGRGVTVHSGPGGEGQKDPERGPCVSRGSFPRRREARLGVRPGGGMEGTGKGDAER